MTATTTTTEEGPAIAKELATGKFTDEMLASMRALIGTNLRTAASINNEYATRTAILRFCEGIGDDNPLWTEADYAETTDYGTLIAPPSFIFACLAGIQVGWPGLGGFHCETKIDFHNPIKVGDKIECRCEFQGFDGPIEQSNFGGRRIKDYILQQYTNQDGELIADFICSRMRFERGEMQKRAETREITVPHPWKDEEIEEIEAGILKEAPRGAVPRYWEDVEVGEEIDVITKGPLGLTDFIAFIAGGSAPIPRVAAHSVSLKRYHKHPKWAFRDPKTHSLEPVYSVHYNDYAASLQGAQMAYDVGIQRTSWQIHSLTNWMGDAGWLKQITGQYRSHVYLSDVVRLGGRIDAKEVDDLGNHIVKLTTWAINQRGQNCMPGTAIIVLPAREA
ncbi:MaoC family dehydratase N-terminal domain-containing protein [Sphingomonas sp. BIUV-7]|uniref:MaoC family dehydratase N-terminal domain-containing protein n=1 Tax=Sphingomonas natans TaxID=3063330 RepID=A0ABT8Y6X3_9SPHN|nr:MaoC family dehydratase N-terminal domain-containing protein [Sphingomonas sp. BIUV-7]MDO6414071.1 MaoC family dehydratase N-terminal domain-containing protein [Sphingomonas sp. BIUV-7]